MGTGKMQDLIFKIAKIDVDIYMDMGGDFCRFSTKTAYVSLDLAGCFQESNEYFAGKI